jgi:hypothetical protein
MKLLLLLKLSVGLMKLRSEFSKRHGTNEPLIAVTAENLSVNLLP